MMRFFALTGLAFAVAGLVLAPMLLPVPALAGELSGPAQALDGNHLVVAERIVRLAGSDAPDTTQPCYTETGSWPCGERAKALLARLVQDGAVRCVVEGEGLRLRGRCEAGGRDLALAMIGEGLALALADAPEDYLRAQAEAKAAERGLWRGRFKDPAEWRASAVCSCELRKKAITHPLERERD